MKTTLWRALARVAATAATTLALFPAAAQDAATGKMLYEKTFVTGVRSCTACHFGPPKTEEFKVMIRGADANRIRGVAMTQTQMKPLYGVITDAEYNHMAKYIADEFGVAPTYISVTAASSPGVSATSLTFASQKVGTTSTPQTVTVTNAAGATAALALSGINTTAGSDFAVTGGTCTLGAGIAAGASCTVSVVFKPTAAGTRSSTLTLTHNGTAGKHEVALSGAAVDTAPLAAVSPATLSFSSLLNTDSTVMRATLSNTGNAALVLSSLGVAGTHAADFRLASSTTCTTTASVAASSSCVIDVVFKPTATGARSAMVAIAHNATGGSTAVSLNGTGTLTAEPGIALDATELDLGSQPVGATSAAKTLTLTNTGGAALNVTSVTVGGTDFGDFVRGGTCTAGSSVASRGTCTITVAMKPDVLGAKTATLTLASNATGGAVTVALRGTAVRTPAPAVGLSQAAVGFGTVTIGTTSVARNVVLTNTGTAAMKVTSIASGSTEFPTTHDCGQTLAVGASCLVTVSYKPTATVATEAIVVTTDALSSPNTIVLTGDGTTQAMSVLAWQSTATSLTFASTVVGETSASQTLTLVNKGPGAVSLTTLGVAGASATSFAITSTSTCKLGLSLAVNGTCTVVMSFVPGAAGPHAASLQLAGTGTLPGDITLTGTAAAKTNPTGQLTGDVATLDFSSVIVAPGTSSTAKVLTVKNTGSAAAAITGITATGPFAVQSGVSGACPTGASSLAAGASCKVSVVFSPTAAGTATGTLTVGSATTPLSVSLKGLSLAATSGVLSANPTQLDFTSPATLPGQTSAAKTVTISNGAIAAVTLGATNVTGPFKVSASTCGSTLATNANCAVSVTFAPTAAGAASGELTVASATGQVLSVTLAGMSSSGTTPTDPGTPGTGGSAVLSAGHDSLGFTGALGVPSRAETTRITNSGTVALVLRDINTSSPFEVVASAADACKAAQTLAPQGSCEIAVVFRAPMSTGDTTGYLTVTANAAGSTTVETRAVRLDGRAMSTNAGSSDDEKSGGGAVDPLALLLLAAVAATLLAARHRRGTR